jgi:predicted DNA binding CopG/RHH family protein
MPEVLVKARISEEHLRAYKAEARRQGVPVAMLVQQTVNCLLQELEREQKQCQEVVTS